MNKWDCRLSKASEKGFIDDVKKAISKGADINVRNELNGMTPLIQAVFKNNIELVTYLVENGADLNIKDNNGWTALVVASMKVPNADSMDVLWFGSQADKDKIFSFLKEHGAHD